MTKLKRLCLNYNYHTNLPAALAKLENLEELSMFYNYEIESIPAVVCELKKIQALNFSYCNKLRTVPERIGKLLSLETLHLHESPGITFLPKDIGGVKNLKQLFLSRTKIEQLPSSISMLENLEILDLGISTLDLEDTIPKIKGLKKIHTLTLDNRLEYPESFSELGHMKKLKIMQNYELFYQGHKKINIPEAIGLMQGLEEIELNNNNQAAGLPESIGNLKNLRKIEVYATAVRHFPESMRSLTKIESICGNLSKEDNSPFGIPKAEKEKLMQWFPKAKIWIY